MKTLDPGHIYRIESKILGSWGYLKFVKRSGGAVTYAKEWHGVQTQAVMRALIDFIGYMQADDEGEPKAYPLW